MPWACHQSVDRLEVLGELLELREIDAGQVLRLIDHHLRFVLQRLDLVVDLGERPRGGEQVLAVVARIEHGELRVGRRAGRDQRDRERAEGAKAQRGRDQMFATRNRHGTSLLGLGDRKIGEEAGGPVEASSFEEAGREILRAMLGEQCVDARLRRGIGSSAQRQRKRTQA